MFPASNEWFVDHMKVKGTWSLTLMDHHIFLSGSPWTKHFLTPKNIIIDTKKVAICFRLQWSILVSWQTLWSTGASVVSKHRHYPKVLHDPKMIGLWWVDCLNFWSKGKNMWKENQKWKFIKSILWWLTILWYVLCLWVYWLYATSQMVVRSTILSKL